MVRFTKNDFCRPERNNRLSDFRKNMPVNAAVIKKKEVSKFCNFSIPISLAKFLSDPFFSAYYYKLKSKDDSVNGSSTSNIIFSILERNLHKRLKRRIWISFYPEELWYKEYVKAIIVSTTPKSVRIPFHVIFGNYLRQKLLPSISRIDDRFRYRSFLLSDYRLFQSSCRRFRAWFHRARLRKDIFRIAFNVLQDVRAQVFRYSSPISFVFFEACKNNLLNDIFLEKLEAEQDYPIRDGARRKLMRKDMFIASAKKQLQKFRSKKLKKKKKQQQLSRAERFKIRKYRLLKILTSTNNKSYDFQAKMNMYVFRDWIESLCRLNVFGFKAYVEILPILVFHMKDKFSPEVQKLFLREWYSFYVVKRNNRSLNMKDDGVL